MSTKIRLQRQGKKGAPFYHVVVADSKSPRDGKFIERLGTYDPNKNPSAINIDFERALYWIKVGAETTETSRFILSDQGVMLKYHLDKGLDKGALTAAQVEEKFTAWKKQRDARVAKEAAMIAEKKLAAKKARLEADKKANVKRSEKIAAKKIGRFTAEGSNSENTITQ